MECIVLAGGLGTRLRSVVSDLPKCMAPIAGKPFLHYVFQMLGEQGCTHLILSVGYMGDVIANWVDSQSWPFKITIVTEDEPLGTGGAIKKALTYASEETVFAMNGDTLFSVNLKKMTDFHHENNSEMTLALKPMTNFDRYGNVEIDSNNRILSFKEKDYCESGQISGGFYLLNRNKSLLEELNTKFSIETDLLQKKHKTNNLYGYLSDGYFIDIGIPEDFKKANIEFKEMFK